MTSKQKAGRWLSLLASLGGIAASVKLVMIYLKPSDTGLCGVSETINCASAAQSDYATIAGIPISLLGLAFYMGAFFLWVRAGGRKPDRESSGGIHLLPLFYTGAVGYSVYLALVSVFILGAICPWCSILYVVNIIGLAGSIIWCGRGPLGSLRGVFSDPKDAIRNGGLNFVILYAALVALGYALLNAPGIGVVAPVDPEAGPADESVLRSEDAPAEGPADAPVVIVEFSDFQCPYCSRLSETMHEIKEEFGDEVRVEFRHFPLDFHTHAEPAARAAFCAHVQDDFWTYHDLLFGNQGRLGEEGIFIEFAAEAGLDTAEFEFCMDSEAAAEAVEADRVAGQELGVQGTPAFFVNGEHYAGALPFADVARLVNRALDDAN